jgi:hypothetical protein
MPEIYDFTWKDNFKSKRSDGYHLSSLAANMERLRDFKPELEFSAKLSYSEFQDWKRKVKNKLHDLMCFFEFKKQPEPVLTQKINRNGYQVQRWEFFPDAWTVVPALILIPEEVSSKNKAPGVFCFPGSGSPKELLAGEPLLNHPNCQHVKYPERNAMALHYAKAGMVSVAFDNPGTAELAEFTPSGKGTHGQTRIKLCGELLLSGHNYLGLSVFQKLCFLEWFKKLDFINSSKIAVSGHSLGSEPAMVMGLLSDDVSAVVFNDFLCDSRRREVATTNLKLDEIRDVDGNWHHVPGMWKYFGFPDILAAMAPNPLALNEGGVEEHLEKVIAAYKISGAENNLQITYYPKLELLKKQNHRKNKLPLQNLSVSDYYEYAGVDVSDHSFRPEVSVKFLKKHFGATK